MLRKPGGRAALSFVFVTVTLDMLAFGVIIPVLPHLIRELVGGDLATASRWSGVFGTVFALAQFVCSPIQGALSDRFGRRPVILASNLGLSLDFALMALAGSLPLLFVGRLISGVTAASISTSNAYIADVTPPERRAGAFGMMGAAFGIGFVLGPAFGSLLATIDVRAPFWGAAALGAANFLYGLVVLPESLPPERRSARLELASPLRALRQLARYPQVLGIATVMFLFSLAHHVLPATFVLYADHRYGWHEGTVGWVLAAAGVSGAVVQAGLAGKVVARIGEERTLLLGVLFGVVGFAIYGLAPTGAWFAAGIPVMALWGLGSPASQAMASRRVDPTEQGRLQGALGSLQSLSGLFGPLLFASVFAAAIEPGAPVYVPGAALLLASAIVAVAGAVAWRAIRAAT